MKNKPWMAHARLFQRLLGTRTILLAFGSSLLISVLELAGLGLVFPLMKLVTDPGFYVRATAVFQGTPIEYWFERRETGILVLGLALAACYLAKAVIHTMLARYQARVAARISVGASDELIRSALAARYRLFMDRGAVTIAGVSYSNAAHAALLFQALMAAANELVLLVLILIGAFVLSPAVSAALLVFIAFAGGVFFVPASRRVAAIGRASQSLDLARHRFVFAMASAIRDIKIMGLEKQFVKRNFLVVDGYASLLADYQTVATALRIAVETLLVCALIAACVWLGYIKESIEAWIPLLGTLGLIAVRAAPALSRLMANFSAARYSLPFVQGLVELNAEVLRNPQIRDQAGPRLPGEISARQLAFSYGAKQVLREVSFVLPQGKMVAIVGSSGSGKSTLLDLLAGLQPPDSGSFQLDGVSFEPFRSGVFSADIGYVPQTISLLDASLAFNICLDESVDAEKLKDAVRRANLCEFVAGLAHGLDTLLGEGGQGVSGGQRQRIGIARALYRQPSVLILDEVTSALDAATEEVVMDELIQLRGGVSLLLVTHKQSTAARADMVYVLDQGVLVLQENTKAGVGS